MYMLRMYFFLKFMTVASKTHKIGMNSQQSFNQTKFKMCFY